MGAPTDPFPLDAIAPAHPEPVEPGSYPEGRGHVPPAVLLGYPRSKALAASVAARSWASRVQNVKSR
jgi:hypothetical protein